MVFSGRMLSVERLVVLRGAENGVRSKKVWLLRKAARGSRTDVELRGR